MALLVFRYDNYISSKNTTTLLQYSVLECVNARSQSSFFTPHSPPPQVLSRTAQDSAALTKLKPVWRENKVSFGLKVMCSLHFCTPVSYGPWWQSYRKGSLWDEMLPKGTEHLIQGPCHQWACSQKDQSSHWKISQTPDNAHESEIAVVWPYLKVV